MDDPAHARSQARVSTDRCQQRAAVIVALAIALLSSACSMRGTLEVPTAVRTITIATSVDNALLFSCAQRRIDALTATSSAWRRVSRNDPASGILESGNFDDANAAGFRVRLQRTAAQAQANMTMTGGGPYNIDLGVEAAADSLTTST